MYNNITIIKTSKTLTDVQENLPSKEINFAVAPTNVPALEISSSLEEQLKMQPQKWGKFTLENNDQNGPILNEMNSSKYWTADKDNYTIIMNTDGYNKKVGDC